MKLLNTGAVAAIAALIAVPADAAPGNARNGLIAMSQLNVLVLEGLSFSGGETEGKVYVGGDFTGGSTQVGFGNSSQGLVQSDFATLSVGGTLTTEIKLMNRSNGGNGNLGSYRAHIVGNVTKKLDLQDEGAVVRVGGDLFDVHETNGSSVYVVGNLSQTVALGDHSITSVGGNAGGFNAGNSNAQVNVTKNVGVLQVGQGAQVRIGGDLGSANLSNGQLVEVAGSIGNSNLGNNNIVKAIGNISGNGSNGTTIYTAGTFSGNANGATINQNFAFGGAVSAPTVPVAPTVESLADTTAQLKADVGALSLALGAMTATDLVTGAPGAPNQMTFKVTDADPATAAVFALNYAQFQAAQQFQFDFANLTKPVVVNIFGSDNGTINWNANAASSNAIGNLNLVNQSIIWNFLDATTLNINSEVHGSVLAPLAVVHNNANINGSVVAKIFNQSAEVHLGTYFRNIDFIEDSTVPEPAVWMQMIAGFGLAGTVIRRRRKAALA